MLLFGGVGAIAGPVIAAVANILFRVFFPKKAAKKNPRGNQPDADKRDEQTSARD